MQCGQLYKKGLERLHFYQMTEWPIPCRRVLLTKADKDSPDFYATPKDHCRVHSLPLKLSRARWIESENPNLTSVRSIMIRTPTYADGLFPSDFPGTTVYDCSSHVRATCPCILFSWFHQGLSCEKRSEQGPRLRSRGHCDRMWIRAEQI